MKKIFALLLIAAFLLCGCKAAPADGSTVAETTTAAPTETTASAPVWTGYTGSTKDYVYYYESGRDLEWEEDVLYVAGVFLGEVFANGHPRLTDTVLPTEFALDSPDVQIISHYDGQLREQFIRDINELIPLIGEMRDYEILYALQKAVARLGDLHSSIYTIWEYMYPMYVRPFYEGGEVRFCVTSLPEKYEDRLYSRLVAINGIPMEEVIDRIAEYDSCENEYALNEDVAAYVCCNEMLTVCGVTEYKEVSTQFTLEARDGTRTTIALDAMTNYRLYLTNFVGVTEASAGFLTESNTETPYWWEYLEEDGILYVRFNEVKENYYLNYAAFTNQLREYIKQGSGGQTVVMDFRSNPGGYFDVNLAHRMAGVLNMEQVEKAYVLIDSASYSGAILMPGSIRQLSDKAVLVGSPGGQPASFFASNYTYTMPNSEHSFCMSDSWWVTDPDDNGDALMPDVVVWQTLDDLIAGRDTVLEYIRAQ